MAEDQASSIVDQWFAAKVGVGDPELSEKQFKSRGSPKALTIADRTPPKMKIT